jgi:hypothetical protein
VGSNSAEDGTSENDHIDRHGVETSTQAESGTSDTQSAAARARPNVATPGMTLQACLSPIRVGQAIVGHAVECALVLVSLASSWICRICPGGFTLLYTFSGCPSSGQSSLRPRCGTGGFERTCNFPALSLTDIMMLGIIVVSPPDGKSDGAFRLVLFRAIFGRLDFARSRQRAEELGRLQHGMCRVSLSC